MWPRLARETSEIGAAAGETVEKPGNLVRTIGRERRGQARRSIEQAAASREKIKDQSKGGEVEKSGEKLASGAESGAKTGTGGAAEGVYFLRSSEKNKNWEIIQK